MKRSELAGDLRQPYIEQRGFGVEKVDKPGFAGVAGRLRTPDRPGDVVQIGSFGHKEDSIYNPAPPRQVKRCLDEVLEWMSDDSLIEPGDAGMGMALPICMAVGHAQIEAVHPFRDGNGRIGRMLWALQMVAAGRLSLYLSSFVAGPRLRVRSIYC